MRKVLLSGLARRHLSRLRILYLQILNNNRIFFSKHWITIFPILLIDQKDPELKGRGYCRAYNARQWTSPANSSTISLKEPLVSTFLWFLYLNLLFALKMAIHLAIHLFDNYSMREWRHWPLLILYANANTNAIHWF